MDEQTRKLLIDGCTMGIKTLGEKTHQYDKADKKAADLAQKIIRTDEELMKKLKDYLYGERESPKQCGRGLSIDIFLTFLLFSCFFEYNSGEKENLSC